MGKSAKKEMAPVAVVEGEVQAQTDPTVLPEPIDLDKETYQKMRKDLKQAKRLIEKGPELIAKLEERVANVGKDGGKNIDYAAKVAELKAEWEAQKAQADVIAARVDELKRSLGYKPRKANPTGKPRIVADPIKLRRVAFRKALVKRGFEFTEDVGVLGNLEITLDADTWTLVNVDKNVTLAEDEAYGKGSADRIDLLRAA